MQGLTVVTVAASSIGVPTTIQPLSDVFSLTAIDTANGSLIKTFAGAPLLTITYDANGPTPTAIYYIDPSGTATPLASTVDPAAHTISAALPHFSDFVAAAPTPTVTWVGTTGGDWNTASRWSTGAVPQATDDVFIGLSAGQVVTISSGTVTVNTLTCDCALTVNSGVTLTLGNASQINGTLTLAGGTVGGAGALTVNGPFNVSASGSALSGAGVFTTQGASTVNIPSAGGGFLAVVGGKSWVNEGTLTIAGDDRVFFGFTSGGANSLTNAAGATIELASTFATPLDFFTGTASLTNLGTINLSVSGSHTIANGIAFNNGGTVNVNAGTFVVAGSGTDSGLYTVAAGATINFQGGTRTLAAGSDITGAGTLTVSGSIVSANASLTIAASGAALNVSSGTLNVNVAGLTGTVAPVTVSGGVLNFNSGAIVLPSLLLSGGTLGGTADMTVDGTFSVTVSGSTLSGPGTFTTLGQTTVNIPSTGGGFLAVVGGKAWVNQGTLTIAGDDRVFFGFTSGGVNSLTNAAGATIELASTFATPLDFFTGTASLTNLGTINSSASGSHTIANGIAFGNGGTVNVNAGTFVVGGSGTDSGIYTVAAGATINFQGGTRTLADGSDITGAGTLTVSGATVNANGALTIVASGAALNVSNGVLNVNAAGVSGLLAPVTVGGGTLSFNSGAVVLPSVVLSGGTLGGTAAVTIADRFDVTASSSLSGSGQLRTLGQTTVSVPSTGGGFLAVIGGKSWVNEGTLTIAGDDRVFFGFTSGGANSLTNAAGATIELASTFATPLDFFTGTASLTNLGTINSSVSGSHTIANGIAFGNGGTVNVNAGTFVVAGSGTDSGLYTVVAGATINFQGGTRTLAAGSDITGAGTLTVSGSIVSANASLTIAASGAALNVSSGVLNVNAAGVSGLLVPVTVSGGTLSFNSGAVVLPSVVLSGGTLSGSAAVTVTGAFSVTVSGSVLSGTGTFTTQGQTTVSMPSAGNGLLAVIGGKAWVNEGTLTIAGDDRVFFGFTSGGANSLTNAAGATIELASSFGTPLDFFTGTASLTNLGTINSSVSGSHTIANGIAFNNGGTVNVSAGTLVVAGSGTDTGVYALSPGTGLIFSGGTRTLAAGSDITGAGTLTVSGAIVSANASLTIAASGAALIVSSGTLNVNVAGSTGTVAPVTVSGGVLNFNSVPVVLQSVLLSGGTLGGTAAVTVNGAFSVTVSGSVLSGTGTFTTQGASTLNMPGGGGFVAVTGGKPWINAGTLTIAGDDRVFFGFSSGGVNSLTNAVGGTVELASTFATPLDFFTGTASVTNMGTLNSSAAGSHAINANIAFNNGGAVNVNAGTLVVGGGGTDSGVYSVAAGAALNFQGGTRTLGAGSDITGAGTVTVAGATVTVNVSLTLAASNTALVISSGTLSFNATQSVPSLVLAGGTLAGTGVVTVTGTFSVTVSGSVLRGLASFTTLAQTTVNMPGGGGFLAVTGGTSWTNAGTLTIAGDDRVFLGFSSGGVNSLTNALGGTVELASTFATPLDFFTGTASVTNMGTLNSSAAGSHAINANIAFNNGGAVNVNAGTLVVGGGGTDSGVYSVAAGAALNFQGGTRTLGAGSDITGAGTVTVAGATVTVNVSLTLAASNTALVISSGTLSFNATQSVPSLVLAGGTLAGTGVVTVTGTFSVTVSGSVLRGLASFTTLAQTTVNMPGGGGFLAVTGGTSWTNAGTLTIAGDDRVFLGFSSGGVNSLTNALGGTVELASTFATPLDFFTGTASVTNLGTLVLTATGSHAINANIALANSGTLDVEAGTLTYGNGLANQGTVTVAPGGRLSLTGSFTNDPAAVVRIGLGNATTFGVLAATGVASLAGTLDVYLTGGFIPDAAAVFGVMTYASHTGAFTILRGETPGGSMDFTVDTASDPKVLKVRDVNVSTVVPGSDLVPTQPVLAPGTTAQSGATITIQWSDTNTGTLATATSWTDHLVLRNTGTNEVLADLLIPYDATVNGPIAAGGAASRQATVVLPDGPRGAGQMSVTLTVDAANDVAETNAQGTAELNNGASLSFSSALAPYPDLVVTDLAVVPGVGWLPGDSVTVTWTTSNQGDGPTPGSWDETVRIRNLTNGQTLFTLHVPYTGGPLASGATTGRTVTVTWPAGSSGTGRIEVTVTTDAAGQVFENNAAGTAETNNAAQIVVLSASDLVVTNLATDTSSPQTGSTITVTWTDANVGTAPVAGSWFDRVRIVNQTTGTVLADQQVQGSANGSFAFHIPDGNAGVGVLRIQVTVDTTNVVTEVNAAGTAESNNTATLDVTSTLAAYPDLQVTDLSVSPAGGWAPGTTVTIGWTTRNQGNAATTGSWVESVTVVNLTTGQTLLNLPVPFDTSATGPLASLGSRSRSATLIWPTGTSGLGQFRFTVTTDSTGQVFESNAAGTGETNNTAQLTVVSAPDLQVANLATAPSSVQAGASVTVSWADQNAGTAALVAGWSDRVVARNLDTGEVLVTATVPAAATGSRSYVLALPQGLRGTGRIEVTVTVDSANAVPESDETNNSAVLTFTSTATPYADLAVTNLQAPASARGGQPATFSWTVTNTGSADAQQPWSDRLVLSPNPVIGDGDELVLATVVHTATLAPGASYTATATVASLSLGLTGTWYVSVIADVLAQVTEPDTRANNTLLPPVPIALTSPFADLQVEVAVAPAQVTEGTPLVLSWRIRNAGDGTTAASQWSDAVYLSADSTLDAGDVLLGLVTHTGAVAAGDSYTVNTSFTAPLGIPGTYRVLIDTDHLHAVYEGSFEGNNVGVSIATVELREAPTPDLVVQSVSGPSVLVAGASATLTWTVANVGETTAVGSWSDALYLSRDGSLIGAFSLASVAHTQALAVGASYTATATITVPDAADGTLPLRRRDRLLPDGLRARPRREQRCSLDRDGRPRPREPDRDGAERARKRRVRHHDRRQLDGDEQRNGRGRRELGRPALLLAGWGDRQRRSARCRGATRGAARGRGELRRYRPRGVADRLLRRLEADRERRRDRPRRRAERRAGQHRDRADLGLTRAVRRPTEPRRQCADADHRRPRPGNGRLDRHEHRHRRRPHEQLDRQGRSLARLGRRQRRRPRPR